MANCVNLGDLTGAVICDLSLGACFTGTLTGDVTIGFTDWPASPALTEPMLIFTQDGTGGRAITITGVAWVPGGVRPVLDTSPGAAALIRLSSPDGGSHLYGQGTTTGPVVEIINTVGDAASAQTIPDPSALSNATISLLTLTAANCVLTLPANPSSGAASMTIVLIQDATGGRTVTWPAVTQWPARAGPPALTVAATSADIFTLMNWGSGWCAFASGLNMG